MKRLLSMIMLAACLCACGGNGGPRLVIIHVNDTHSHMEPVRSGVESGRGGIIERAAFVDSVRNAAGAGNVLLLHAGDWNQGTSYYNTLKGAVEVDMVNAMGYDCITLGNHEFDNGLEDLAARLALVECPVVNANIDFSGGPVEGLVKPYVILHKAGLKIGVLGMAPELQGSVDSRVVAQLRQLDAIACINATARELKEEKKCDMVIVLSHMGYEEDMSAVPQIRNVDAIVGGHSHTRLTSLGGAEDLDGRFVPVVQDWLWGLEIGELKVY